MLALSVALIAGGIALVAAPSDGGAQKQAAPAIARED
jgi:hypothetical protein